MEAMLKVTVNPYVTFKGNKFLTWKDVQNILNKKAYYKTVITSE